MKYRNLPGFAVLAILFASVSACGGSAGGDTGSGDTGDIARDESTPLPDPRPDLPPDSQPDPQPDPQQDPLQDDPQVVDEGQQNNILPGEEEIDIAVFFLTAPDRQWTCEITSAASTRYDDIYFSADGTVVFASDGVWSWSKTVAGDEINLTSPDQSSMLMSDISSSNTVLMFNTSEEAGLAQTFDCVLTYREINI